MRSGWFERCGHLSSYAAYMLLEIWENHLSGKPAHPRGHAIHFHFSLQLTCRTSKARKNHPSDAVETLARKSPANCGKRIHPFFREHPQRAILYTSQTRPELGPEPVLLHVGPVHPIAWFQVISPGLRTGNGSFLSHGANQNQDDRDYEIGRT